MNTIAQKKMDNYIYFSQSEDYKFVKVLIKGILFKGSLKSLCRELLKYKNMNLFKYELI